MSTEDIERTQSAYEAALSVLLLEFESLTDKELSRLDRRHLDLRIALDRVKDTRKDLHDIVFAEAQAHLDADQAELDGLVACLQILNDDGGYDWVAHPEVTNVASGARVVLFKQRHDGGRTLIRDLPRDWVGEIRNVPKEHPLVLTSTEWTLANQGEPSWSDELVSLEPRIQHLATSNGIDPDVLRRYVANEGEMPDDDWYQLVKATNLQSEEVEASQNAE